jgi:hypothetical protein
MANATLSQSEEMEKLRMSYREELNTLRIEMEGSACQIVDANAIELSNLYSSEAETFGTHLRSSADEEMQCVLAQAQGQHDVEVQRIINKMNAKRLPELERIKVDMMAMANNSQSEQVEQLIASHNEELVRCYVSIVSAR